jgi:N-methylhydantoinase B
VRGGADGARPCITIERPGATPEEVRKANIPVGPGDRVRVQTSGGGGYGDPLKREAAKVAADVRSGYVSREAAEHVYGVVLDRKGAVLAHETAERRARRAAQG